MVGEAYVCLYSCSRTFIRACLYRDFAYSFSPLIEETRANTVVLDVEGCELLFGSAYQLAREIAERSKKSKTDGGLQTNGNVALAANPDAAIHAATYLKGVTFVAPGEELTCLGEFPITSPGLFLSECR